MVTYKNVRLSQVESSRPKELPLEALTEPDVNVSAHPALPIQSLASLLASGQTAPVAYTQYVSTSGPRAACGSAVFYTYALPILLAGSLSSREVYSARTYRKRRNN